MQINKEVIKSFNPCVDRWKNYLEYYSEFDGTFDEFIDLPKISHDDKTWIAQKLMTKNQAVHFAIRCAESVVDNFNKVFPDDKRLAECFEYLKSIPDYSNLTLEEISRIKFHESAVGSAAGSAARSAAESAESARSAAESAGSAGSAARSAAESARSATESARSAAWSAAWSAAESAAGSAQQKLILEFLKIAMSL